MLNSTSENMIGHLLFSPHKTNSTYPTEKLRETPWKRGKMAMEGRRHEKERDIDDLPKNEANYTALTPLWFLKRAALVHPHRRSVVHGSVQYTWLQTYLRCCRLSSALSKHSVGFGSTVSISSSHLLDWLWLWFYYSMRMPMTFEVNDYLQFKNSTHESSNGILIINFILSRSCNEYVWPSYNLYVLSLCGYSG